MSSGNNKCDDDHVMFYNRNFIESQPEICQYCNRPFVSILHSGYLSCLNVECENYGQRLFVTENDSSSLPFGSEGSVLSKMLGKTSSLDYTVKVSEGASQTASPSCITTGELTLGARLKFEPMLKTNKKYAGDSMLLSPEYSIMGVTESHFKFIEIVFGYSNSAKRNASSKPFVPKNINGVRVPRNDDEDEEDKTNTSTSTNLNSSSSYVLKSSSLKRETLKKSEVLLTNGKVISTEAWHPGACLLQYIAFQLCVNVCKQHMSNDDFLESHPDAKNVFYYCSERRPGKSGKYLYTKCDKCYWKKNPINIGELKILLSAIHNATGDKDWHMIASNAYFLNKIYILLYGMKTPSITSTDLSFMTKMFYEAKNMEHLITSTEEKSCSSMNPPNVLTSSALAKYTPEMRNAMRFASSVAKKMKYDVRGILTDKMMSTINEKIDGVLNMKSEKNSSELDDMQCSYGKDADMNDSIDEVEQTAHTTISKDEIDTLKMGKYQKVPSKRPFKPGLIWALVYLELLKRNERNSNNGQSCDASSYSRRFIDSVSVMQLFPIPLNPAILQVQKQWWDGIYNHMSTSSHSGISQTDMKRTTYSAGNNSHMKDDPLNARAKYILTYVPVINKKTVILGAWQEEDDGDDVMK